MREILFRGKRIFDGKWVNGFAYKQYSAAKVEEWYIRAFETDFLVIPETVSQFTGLTDKNGRKIFEGDIIKGKVHEMNGYRVRKGVIEYHDTGFIMNLKPNSDSGYDQKNVPFEREVIGNVFDNPELLEVKKNG